jgi:hypothetical protein
LTRFVRRPPKLGILSAKSTGITGTAFCGSIMTYLVCHAVPRQKRARKGSSAIKNATGRQLAWVNVVKYQETVWSDVFPGNYHTVHCLRPAVLAAEIALELASSQCQRTVWRLDGGAGSE